MLFAFRRVCFVAGTFALLIAEEETALCIETFMAFFGQCWHYVLLVATFCDFERQLERLTDLLETMAVILIGRVGKLRFLRRSS